MKRGLTHLLAFVLGGLVLSITHHELQYKPVVEPGHIRAYVGTSHQTSFDASYNPHTGMADLWVVPGRVVCR